MWKGLIDYIDFKIVLLYFNYNEDILIIVSSFQ